jgi:FixJ family two-component response regulator
MSTGWPLVAVVEDDPSVRRGLERLLRSAGLRVETFSSGSAFLERTGAADPDCLVLDVSLPGQSGLSLLDGMRARGRDIPVIFITGHGDTMTVAHAMKAGAYEFLIKPFDGEELLAAIRRATAAPALAPSGPIRS